MKPPTSNRILRVGLTGAVALVLAAPAGARVLPVDEGDGTLARYGWGATSTAAKKKSSPNLAKYGWGAAATYAKLHT